MIQSCARTLFNKYLPPAEIRQLLYMTEMSSGKDSPPWHQLPIFTVLDCESLPDDVIIHREDVFATQEKSAIDTWDFVTDIISPNILDNPTVSKNAQKTI